MSPQEEVSGSNSPMGSKTPLSPVCSEVRLTMDAVRDNRATTADRLFVAAHTENCPGCASEWAFLQATRIAWAKTPMSVPSASLSARIAAATYRKPTFTERLVAAFAFLNPVPVRVAIGVATVAGIAFLALPRMSMDRYDTEPVVSDPPRILAQLTPAKKMELAPVAVTPVEKPAPLIKKTPPKTVMPVAKEAPVIAVNSAAKSRKLIKTDDVNSVSVVENTAPKLAPFVAKSVAAVVTKPKLVQVAINKPKSVRVAAGNPGGALSPDTRPVASEPAEHIASSARPNLAPESKPEARVSAPEPSATVAGIIAPDPEPGFTNGSNRIKLNNTNTRPQGEWSGRLIPTSSSAGDATPIVFMPTKL